MGILQAYRVVWFRPDYAHVESEAGSFFAKSDDEAVRFFQENFQKNQRHSGDTLILYRIIVKEEVQVIATVEAKEIVDD